MKKIIHPFKLSVAVLLLGTAISQAQTTDTWTGGGGDANWSTGGNWLPGAPNPGDNLIFDGSTQTTPNNDFPADTLFGNVTFAPTASAFTLTGNEIYLGGLVENDATNQLQTISLPLVLTNNVTFNTSSNDLNGGASDDILVMGLVSGTGSLTKNGNGVLTLANRSYGGGTTVNGGLLVVSNDNGGYTMSGGGLMLNFRTYFTQPTISFTADSSVGIDLLDNTEPRGVDCYSTIGTASYKFTKIGQGILRMNGSINASSIDVAAGTLASLGGTAQPQTKWGTSPITVENGAMLRADDGGVCPNVITLNGGDGTSAGSYTHEGALVSGSRNNGGSTTNYNIFTNTIILAADSSIGSYFNTMIISGNITGSSSLTKLGASPLFLGGSNSFAGNFNINAGTVQIGSSNALPTTASVTIIGSSVLDLNSNIAFVGGGPYDDGSGLGSLDNSSTSPASLSINSANFVGAVKNTGGGSLSIVNVSGSSSLLGANSYTGSNVVQAGTLEINIPSGTTGGLVSIADTAALTLHKTTPGSSLKAAGAVFGTSGATTLNIDLANYGNPSAPIINATNGTGILSANGTLTINFMNTANLSLGQFAIVKYNSRVGTGNFVFTPIAGITAKIVTNAANKSIDLQITSAPITTWKGNQNNLWDTATANWTLSGSPVVYSDGTAVFFDDTALTNNVNLTAALSPGSVLLNSTNTYTFGGTGPLNGGTLTKNGSGTLILDVSGNGYASTTIGGGTLQVGNNDSNGDLGSGNVDDEGSLIFDLTNNYTVPGVISGAGSVVQNNTNITTLSQANTYSGGTVVSQGVLKLGNNTSLGTPSGSVIATVANGASLDLAGKLLASSGYVSIIGNGAGTNLGVLQTTTGMGCDIGCAAVGVKYLRLAGNASIGDSTGDFQLGTDVNANGGGGVCSIDGQGFSLTKIGGNNLIVEGTNFTALSQFILAGGGMIFANTAKTPFGNSCTMVVSNGAWMDSWDNFANNGITLANNFIVGPGGGELRNTRNMYYNHACYNTFSGAFTLNDNLTVRNISAYSGAPNNVLTLGQMNFTGPISGIGGIYNVGATNTVTLSGANTYIGPTVVSNNGVLQLSGIQQGGGSYLVYDNATLDVPSQTGYSTVPMSTLMVGSASGAILSLSRVSSLSTSTAVITATNLTAIGANSILLPPTAYATPGQYPLIKYTGALSGGGTFVAGASGARGTPGTISNNVANGSIDLVVPGGNPVYWTGSVSTNWDIATTANFSYLGSATTYQQSGSLGDAVTFDDSTAVTNIFLTTPVSPSVVVVNTTNTYTFTGTNITGGSSLVKNGSGVLVLTNRNNTFTSGTFVGGGTLRMGLGLNNLPGTVTVASGATLDLSSNNPSAMIINASGSGVGGAGAIQANFTGGQVAQGVSVVNMTGNLAVGGNNRWDVRNGSKQWNVSTNGLTLTKVGSGYVGLNGVTVSTNLGDITILGGTLSYQAATTGLGNTNNTIYVGNGGALGFNSASVPLTKGIVCSNGAAISSDGGNAANLNIVAGPVRLDSGTISLNLNFYNGITFSNVLSGAGGISLQFQSFATLAASNTYTGNTTVPRCNSASGGLGTRLSLIGNGSITHSALITLQGIQSGQAFAGYLDVNGRTDKTLTLGTNQTLRGDNGSFIRGSVVATAGSAISPGGISTNYQYMSISNSLTFQAGSTNIMDIYKTATLRTNDLITVSNLVTYGGTLMILTNGPAALAVNDTFQLFSAGSSAGNFASIVDPSGNTWSFNPANGVATLTALAPTVNTNRTNIVVSVSGQQLTMSWPADHTGWTLQSNAISLLNTGAWFAVPGSTTTNQVIITMDPSQTNVFYRMKY
jgi:autotransporter-associated beta strand protein